MDPQFRKVALIAASLGLLVALFLALRPQNDGAVAPATSSVATTTAPAPATTAEQPPATTTAVTGSPGPGTIHIDYAIADGKPVGGIGRDSVTRGRIVVIRVTSDVADEVHLHGYDLTVDVAPGAPATIRFTADVPGRFELELENLHLPVAELEVRP